MKTFKSHLNASQADERNHFHIIIVRNTAETENGDEGVWTDSGVMDYWKRLEKPGSDNSKQHLHIARKKNVNTILRKISWHSNGPKSDKVAFNNNLNGVDSAKNIAKAVINLPEDKVLNVVPNENAAELLGGIDYLPTKARIFVFSIADKA
ncbi:DUF6367 family protein [Flavobacterium psychrotrophum]|uniref:DUF6367 family protein n=1 Tax=Flavobacterium psychrotrophum TaxID=2294119 RepID=UPI000E310441|nr:DUF6367 family protein [Flavobacterium psychrotrophum]